MLAEFESFCLDFKYGNSTFIHLEMYFFILYCIPVVYITVQKCLVLKIHKPNSSDSAAFRLILNPVLENNEANIADA